jgi:hypothetical protein
MVRFGWRSGFIRTFVERDIPQLGIRIPPVVPANEHNP